VGEAFGGQAGTMAGGLDFEVPSLGKLRFCY